MTPACNTSKSWGFCGSDVSDHTEGSRQVIDWNSGSVFISQTSSRCPFSKTKFAGLLLEEFKIRKKSPRVSLCERWTRMTLRIISSLNYVKKPRKQGGSVTFGHNDTDECDEANRHWIEVGERVNIWVRGFWHMSNQRQRFNHDTQTDSFHPRENREHVCSSFLGQGWFVRKFSHHQVKGVTFKWLFYSKLLNSEALPKLNTKQNVHHGSLWRRRVPLTLLKLLMKTSWRQYAETAL